MAAKKVVKKEMKGKKALAAGRGKKAPLELIISKSRVKAAVAECNISKEFYEALDKMVRGAICGAEGRALGNKRRTLRPWDL
jgi:hypothetical protein